MPHLGPVLVSGFELMKCLANNSGKGTEVGHGKKGEERRKRACF